MSACPRCKAVAVQFAKPHCANTGCGWVKCQHCGVTYDKTSLVGFHDPKSGQPGVKVWHSSQAA